MNLIKVLSENDIIKTIIYNLRKVDRKESFFRLNLKIRKNTIIETSCSRPFVIKDDAILKINERWSRLNPFFVHITIGKSAKIVVNGKFSFYEGGRIGLSDGAELHVGSGYVNNNFTISCRKKIIIGNEVLIGPNVVIRDSDDHKITTNYGEICSQVVIGDHVWIGTNVIILKGVSIGSGSIIAAGSVVTRSVPENCLAAGVPAKIIKRDIAWY